MRPSWRMRRISVSKSPTFTGQVREVFHQATPAQGQRLAARLIESLPRCPVPEIARLGRTLRKWKDAFLAYFDTGGASNGPTEAINAPPSNTYADPHSGSETSPTTSPEHSSKQEDSDPNYTLNYEEPTKDLTLELLQKF